MTFSAMIVLDAAAVVFEDDFLDRLNLPVAELAEQGAGGWSGG